MRISIFVGSRQILLLFLLGNCFAKQQYNEDLFDYYSAAWDSDVSIPYELLYGDEQPSQTRDQNRYSDHYRPVTAAGHYNRQQPYHHQDNSYNKNNDNFYQSSNSYSDEQQQHNSNSNNVFKDFNSDNYNSNQQPYNNGKPSYNSYNNVFDDFDNDYNNNNYYSNNSPYTSTSSTTTSTTAAPPGLTCGRPESGVLDPFGVANQMPPADYTRRRKELFNVTFTNQNQIVGGETAVPGQVCWQVNLIDARFAGPDQGYCGGSILSDRWILTAAHCVADSSASELTVEPRDLFVIAGSLVSDPFANNVTTPAACAQRIRARRIVVHPDFVRRPGTNYFFVNDLALIELTAPISLGTNCACPICLKNMEPFPGELGVASGFGCMSQDCSDDTFPVRLQWTQTMYVDDNASSCFNAPNVTDSASDVILCGGGIPGLGTCQGDSGGPYVFWDRATMRFYQKGAISYGGGDNGLVCAGSLATRFTDLSRFLAFIKQTVPEAQVL